MEIVTQDDSQIGRHNANLAASTSRIIEGGTWKRQRIVEIMPSSNMVPAKVVLSWRNLITPPNQPYHRHLVLGCEVGDAYDRAIAEVLSHRELREWEYILTIEADNVPPVDGVVKLIKRMEEHPELHCIGGLYWTKGEGGVPQIWGDPKDPVVNYRPQAPKPGEVVECCGTGMGFNLWRMSMFRELAEKHKDAFPRPWFKTAASATEGTGTQDLYFWARARPLGYRCAIDCDCLVGHYDARTGVCW